MRNRLIDALGKSSADYAEIRLEIEESTRLAYRGHEMELADSSAFSGGIARACYCIGYEAVIFGQRIGSLLKESVGDSIIWKPLIENLVSLLEGSPHLDEDVKRFYLSNGFVSSNFIVISELREAPAIGAGVDVYLHYKVGG